MNQNNSAFLSAIILILINICSCQNSGNSNHISKAKQDVLKTEKEFEACATKEGMSAAFTKFADDSAAINRKGKVIKGKQAIREFYEKQKASKDHLSWDADFVDVSSSCDMAYTYGSYTYTAIDSTGKETDYNGIFHTVWKKQTDGTWRYVWD
jgi:uncharacterized protein (TIGR02246 family)